MASINKCIFIGRMTADPEVRQTETSQVANFTIAVSEKYKDRQGNPKEDTQFIRCNAWGNLSVIISTYTRKGSLVYVEGKWKTRDYEKNGEKRYVTEVQVFSLQMLDSKKDSGGQQQNYQQSNEPMHNTPPQSGNFQNNQRQYSDDSMEDD